jgi:hypothetical protein
MNPTLSGKSLADLTYGSPSLTSSETGEFAVKNIEIIELKSLS